MEVSGTGNCRDASGWTLDWALDWALAAGEKATPATATATMAAARSIFEERVFWNRWKDMVFSTPGCNALLSVGRNTGCGGLLR